jgi:hypothetical protein
MAESIGTVFNRLAWAGPLGIGLLLVIAGFLVMFYIPKSGSGSPAGSIYYLLRVAYYMVIVGLLSILIWAATSSIARVIAAGR